MTTEITNAKLYQHIHGICRHRHRHHSIIFLSCSEIPSYIPEELSLTVPHIAILTSIHGELLKPIKQAVFLQFDRPIISCKRDASHIPRHPDSIGNISESVETRAPFLMISPQLIHCLRNRLFASPVTLLQSFHKFIPPACNRCEIDMLHLLVPMCPTISLFRRRIPSPETVLTLSREDGTGEV